MKNLLDALVFGLTLTLAIVLTALIAILATSNRCQAADHLLMPLASYHTDRAAHYNETNLGIGLAHDLNDDVSLVALRYRNSFHRTTVAAGISYQPLLLGRVKAGVLALIATGYKSPIVIAPAITYQGDRYGADIALAPAIGKGSTAFIGLQLRMRIN